MKFLSALPLILSAGIAISQVSAAPLRVVVVKGTITTSGGFIRVGHPAANNGDPTQSNVASLPNMHMKPKHGCAGSLRNKAKQISNWFRVTFGMPAIQSDKAIVPANGVVEAAPLRVAHLRPHPMNSYSHHIHAHHHIARPHTFVQRLTHALMMLGPWEGRAVSFILGCGIGVLIRMFWVLALLAIRSARGKKQRDEFVEDEVLFEEEQHLLSPPRYVEEYVVTVEDKEETRAT